MKKKPLRSYLYVTLAMAGFPLLFYGIVFAILTYPLLHLYSTHFFADMGDGLQNVWNIWWVNKAVTQLNQSPWHTEYLHYPHGISLSGSTLNPFNGFMGIVLLKFMTLIEAYNFIVVFSFVMGGVTAFWLAYYITRAYWGSILAGFIFTFSSYHFAHAEGHLQLVSLEWLPLFLLCWYRFLKQPSVSMAVAAGIVLFAVILCDYYYFLYSVIAGGLLFFWHTLKNRDLLFFYKRGNLMPFGVFILIVALTAGPLVFSLLLLNHMDPLQDFHSPLKSSMDLLAPVIPGGHWRFAGLTQFYWSRLSVNIHESSVYMGLSVICLIAYVWSRRQKIQVESLLFWFLALIFFALMSLGPVLHIGGQEIPFIRLPYALFEILFPPLKLSGVPVRMMVMVTLCASVLCAAGFNRIFHSSFRKRWAGILIMMILFLEYLPKQVPYSQPPVPGYVKVLKKLPEGGGIIDTRARSTQALFYQTIHEKPMAFGYVARVPQSVREKEKTVKQLIRDEDFGTLHADWGFKYLVAGADQELTSAYSSLKLIYGDHEACIYELKD